MRLTCFRFFKMKRGCIHSIIVLLSISLISEHIIALVKTDKMNYSANKFKKVEILAPNYSPTLRLLTTYNPIDEIANFGATRTEMGRGRILGVTLYGFNKNKDKPNASSTSTSNAIKLHDDMFKELPRDGKVRVRMYHHRAIHDDVRLYGNGPWKYWGHGWGLEFGYDPKSPREDKNYYQKGYSIERAFGRDFCQDKKNCRKPDPEFFKDPLSAGQYSRELKKLNSNLY